jgi:hypothetical protein
MVNRSPIKERTAVEERSIKADKKKKKKKNITKNKISQKIIPPAPLLFIYDTDGDGTGVVEPPSISPELLGSDGEEPGD